MRARSAAAIGVSAALAIGALAVAKRRPTAELAPAVESSVAARIVRRDCMGLPERKGVVRERPHVRQLAAALGIDQHPGGVCPLDYSEADFAAVLSGSSVYEKRHVYLFGLLDDVGDHAAPPPSVVSVTSAGCRVGPPADLERLRRELRAAGTL